MKVLAMMMMMTMMMVENNDNSDNDMSWVGVEARVVSSVVPPAEDSDVKATLQSLR